MDQKQLDAFLDDATHAVAELYHKASGKQIDDKDLYALNDLLTEFFQKRE